MAQLSRPYQVVIVLAAVLALAWFTVLRSHLSRSSGGSSQPSSTAKAGAIESNEGKPTRVYHGPVTGLKGLSKDISKAHEAVATADAQAQRAESGTASAAGPSVKASAAQPASSTHAAGGVHGRHAAGSVHSTHAAAGAHRSKGAGGTTRSHSRSSASHTAVRSHARVGHSSRPTPVRRHTASVSPATRVAGQLHQGKVVLLLFWKQGSFADEAVRSQVQAASRSLGHRVAADYAKPGEVGAFGTVTRNVSVVQTPTLLIINRRGLATTITGLTDAFAIEQAVREAQG